MINYSNVFSSPPGSVCGQVTGGISGLGAVQEAVLQYRESSVLPGEPRDAKPELFLFIQLPRRPDYKIRRLRRLHLLISSDVTVLISQEGYNIERGTENLPFSEKCVVTRAGDEINSSFHTFPYLQ